MRLIQGPLAGYSCAPFRVLAHQWGRPDYCYTEMLSALQICMAPNQPMRYRYKSPDEGLLCAQLAGDHADVLAQAAQHVVKWGADFVDLNCGCPQPKIRKKNFGSRLLENSTHLYQLVLAMKRAVNVPVFVKIRTDGRSHDRYHQEVALAIQEAGADVITVHGRHWSERYDLPVYYHDIAVIKDTVHIPVIGNGDIDDSAAAKRMLAETGCDGLMIARASVGQPWIFQKIIHELNGQFFLEPSIETVGGIFLAHVEGLMALEGEQPAILQARKLGKYYARAYIQVGSYFDEIVQIKKYSDLQAMIEKYFNTNTAS